MNFFVNECQEETYCDKDYVSSFFRRGKLAPWKAMLNTKN
eukprot:UN17829